MFKRVSVLEQQGKAVLKWQRKDLRESISNKLLSFIESNQIEKPKKTNHKTTIFQPITNDFTLHHGLKRLKNKYDGDIFVKDDGKTALDIQKLTKNDLCYSSPLARTLFDNLVRIKQVKDKRIDRIVVLGLLGLNSDQIFNSYFIVKHVLELLHLDKDGERALYLCRICNKPQAVVAMNLIMKHYFDKNDIKTGFKLYNDRKKWMIPCDNLTYLTLFNGVSRCLTWDVQMNDKRKIIEKCVELFENYRKELNVKQENIPIEVFNACLSLIIKDFTDRQVEAWKFFDQLSPNKELKLKEIIPDIQTFTILLNGIKKYIEHQRELINNDDSLSSDVRLVKLLDLDVGFIKTFEIIYNRVLELAKPPSDFSNPKLVKTYLANKVDIDLPFLSIYISSLINRASGTKTSSSHYLYNELGLKILNEISPELNSMTLFLSKSTNNQEVIKVDSGVKHVTDKQVNSVLKKYESEPAPELQYANSVKELNPMLNLKNHSNFETNQMNPELTFPKFDPQSKTIESYKSNLINLPESINKFILNQYFEALTNLGKLNEFVLAFWFSLIKYGGIQLSLKLFQNKSNFLNGVIIDKNLEDYKTNSTTNSNPSILDSSSINLFIYKISEYGKSQGLTKTNLILEMFKILNTKQFNNGGIQIQFEHIDKIWSTFFNDLKYYNNFNKTKYNEISTLDTSQLNQLIKNLNDYNNLFLIWTRHRFNRHHLPPKSYFENLQRMINILYESNWKLENDELKIYIHKIILKSCLKYYKPKSLQLKNEIHHQWLIQLETSMDYIFDNLKIRKNLNDRNKRLLAGLKLIRSLKDANSDQDKFNKLRNELQSLIEFDDLHLDSESSIEEEKKT